MNVNGRTVVTRSRFDNVIEYNYKIDNRTVTNERLRLDIYGSYLLAIYPFCMRVKSFRDDRREKERGLDDRNASNFSKNINALKTLYMPRNIFRQNVIFNI